ncbi:hypothetical protein Tco_1404985 [Tanacetum coccineum]
MTLLFVLSSEKQVSPRSNCSCKELQSNYDKGHSRVVALEAELKYQLQRKDDTIRNLETHINIMRMLNVGPTTGSLYQQALETEVTQLKDALTSLRIQNDGEGSILNAEIAKLKAEAVGKKNSGPTELVKPKVLASMMYTKSSKYIVPPKRANWVQPTPLPKKKQVTFQDPHRSSPRPAQKPQVQQHKKPTVPVNLINNDLYVDMAIVVHSNEICACQNSPGQVRCVTLYKCRKAYQDDVARHVPHWKLTGKRFNLFDISGQGCLGNPSSSSIVTIGLSVFLLRLGGSHGGSMGFLPSLNDEVNRTFTVADSIAEKIDRQNCLHCSRPDCSLISVRRDLMECEEEGDVVPPGIRMNAHAGSSAAPIVKWISLNVLYKFGFPEALHIFRKSKKVYIQKLSTISAQKSMSSSNAKHYGDYWKKIHHQSFLDSNRYGACETKVQRMQSKVKEDHKVNSEK